MNNVCMPVKTLDYTAPVEAEIPPEKTLLNQQEKPLIGMLEIPQEHINRMMNVGFLLVEQRLTRFWRCRQTSVYGKQLLEFHQ